MNSKGKLLTHVDHPLKATIWAETLRAAGIRCDVRNTMLGGALGEIPFLECTPQLWLIDPQDEHRALQILRDLDAPPAGPAWRCSRCGEESEPQFGSCWSCGTAKA